MITCISQKRKAEPREVKRCPWGSTACKGKRHASGLCLLAAEPASPQNVLFLSVMLPYYLQSDP